MTTSKRRQRELADHSKTLIHLADCRACGTPIIITGVPRNVRARLPYSPNRGPWRAFDRQQVMGEGTYRSSVRHGMVPSRERIGFLPHACPRGVKPTS